MDREGMLSRRGHFGRAWSLKPPFSGDQTTLGNHDDEKFCSGWEATAGRGQRVHRVGGSKVEGGEGTRAGD